jgi:hypothetical protein
MHGFERTSAGYVARLDPFERDVLVQVVADVAELLGDRPLARPAGSRYGPSARGEDDLQTSPGDGPRPDGADAWTSLDPHRDALEPPDDTGVRRLFPDASKDPSIAAEFRRLTEDELRRTKRDRLHSLWESLIRLPFDPDAAELEFVVGPEQASDLAATLTDIRLILADRLGLETDEDVNLLYDELADANTLAELDSELDQKFAASAPAERGAAEDVADEVATKDAAASDGGSTEPALGGDATPLGGEDLDDPDQSERALELEIRAVRASLGTVYIALTWMQESLVEVMTADLGD